jgi:hypothetical protein
VRKAGVRDPLLLLDEVDKMGRDAARGDPAAALLEVRGWLLAPLAPAPPTRARALARSPDACRGCAAHLRA